MIKIATTIASPSKKEGLSSYIEKEDLSLHRYFIIFCLTKTYDQMKKVEKLVLNQMAKKELSQRQQVMIKGGRNLCTCGCCYANSGGSDTTDNGLANCESSKNTFCPVNSSWFC